MLPLLWRTKLINGPFSTALSSDPDTSEEIKTINRTSRRIMKTEERENKKHKGRDKDQTLNGHAQHFKAEFVRAQVKRRARASADLAVSDPQVFLKRLRLGSERKDELHLVVAQLSVNPLRLKQSANVQ
jgi:hypothetical protein